MMTIKSQNQLLILGSGTSTGIPMLGCSCAVCRSPDPKDKRLRTSVFLETRSGQRILVDTGPDLRAQLLNHQIDAIDGVILTHDHADHLHGIDELRPLTFDPSPPLPIWTNALTHRAVQTRFPYLFDRHAGRLGGGKPRLEFHPLDLSVGEVCSQSIRGEHFTFFSNPHGTTESLGLIHEGLGYVIDCHEIGPQALASLKAAQLDLLIIDCVQPKIHQTHLWLERTLEYIREIAPSRAGLIHMGHKFSHQGLEDQLKARGLGHVFVCFDGQGLTYRNA